jgi:hypothetical protein
MPGITVKALAEFAERPIADQMRILAEQKRPAAGAAQFKTHYYQPARSAIRQHHGRGNSPAVIPAAILRVQGGAGPDHRRIHNIRAMQAFARNPSVAGRVLITAAPQTYSVSVHGVDVRLHPDLEGVDGASTKYVLFNYSIDPIDDGLARRTLELMYWLLDGAGATVSPGDCEVICLASDTIHTNNRAPRITILRNAQENLRAINQLWPII